MYSYRSQQVAWTLILLMAACCRQPIQVPPSGDVSSPVARSVVAVDDGERNAHGDDAATRDNMPDLVEIIGTPRQLMKLPSVGRLRISDHAQTQLAHGRWKILGYVSVNDTSEVLAKIRALGLKASVPRSVAERELDMQPTPVGRDAATARWGFPQFRGP